MNEIKLLEVLNMLLESSNGTTAAQTTMLRRLETFEAQMGRLVEAVHQLAAIRAAEIAAINELNARAAALMRADDNLQ